MWPKQLPGGPLLEAIEERSGDYSLKPKAGVELSHIVDLSIFQGYTPELHFEFSEKVDDQPSKYVDGKGRHHYVEHIVPNGRMEFHSEYHEEFGATEWMEFLPTHLPVDSFFDPTIAIAFDLNREHFTVYVPDKEAHEYITVYVKQRIVERIVWLSH